MADAPQNTTTPTAPPLSRGKIFLRRLLSSVVLWTIVLLAIFSNNRIVSDYFFLFVMILLSGAGLVEFYDLARKIGLPCYKSWGIFGGLLLITATFLYLSGVIATAVKPAEANDFETTFLILFVLGLCVRQFVSKRNPEAITAIATTLFGLMYVPWLVNFIQKINFYPDIGGTGKFYVLHFILVTKFSDLGAYVTGSLFGKHKMIPRISPGKTWEGFAGAIVISTLISIGFAHLANLPELSLIHATILGIILSSTAVLGDLIESLFKREAGVKDSGRLFPGIGGILDLMDSLLFNAPLMYLYLRHVMM